MERHTTQHTSRRPDAAMQGQLARLHELNDFKVADGDPDVRGWPVTTADGQRAGKVDDLIVDTGAMQVRYLDVELDRNTLRLNEDRHVLVPISDARLDDVNDDVLLCWLNVEQVARMQPVQQGRPIAIQAPTSERQTRPDTDAREFYGKRGGTGAVQRMTLSGESVEAELKNQRADVNRTGAAKGKGKKR